MGSVAVAVVALGTVGVAHQHRRAARHEASLDKLYERLALANDRLERVSDTARSIYIFTELDNLEYVIEKYKLGYIIPTTRRAPSRPSARVARTARSRRSR
jgi:hypothetical protein